MYLKTITVAILLFASLLAYTQESGQEVRAEEMMKGAHRVTTGLGHSHISKGINAEGKKVWIHEPSWSLSYDYWISNRWAIGLQTDLVLEEYVIEDQNGEEVERERPYALVPVGIFKPFRHFSFIAGAGVELEKKESMGLTRLGAEFACDLPKGWEAGIAVIWDAKWGHYDSWVLEFTFGKIFSKRRK